jgi:hypothetical protein
MLQLHPQERVFEGKAARRGARDREQEDGEHCSRNQDILEGAKDELQTGRKGETYPEEERMLPARGQVAYHCHRNFAGENGVKHSQYGPMGTLRRESDRIVWLRPDNPKIGGGKL